MLFHRVLFLRLVAIEIFYSVVIEGNSGHKKSFNNQCEYVSLKKDEL